jgi:hypothetical protein
VPALRAVHVPAEQIDDQYFAAPNRRQWPQQMKHLGVRRLPPALAHPKDGDVSCVFAIYDQGFEEAHVFFYHDGGWRFLFNTYAVRAWPERTAERLESKLASLRGR